MSGKRQDGWETAGYASLSKTRKGLVLVMGDDKYWIPGNALAKVVNEMKPYTIILEIPKAGGEEKTDKTPR